MRSWAASLLGVQEDLNMRYVGITEAEYEWLTDQIMQVANRWGHDVTQVATLDVLAVASMFIAACLVSCTDMLSCCLTGPVLARLRLALRVRKACTYPGTYLPTHLSTCLHTGAARVVLCPCWRAATT
jgi:hypothetical protein